MVTWIKWCPKGCGRRMGPTDKKQLIKQTNRFRYIYRCSDCGLELTLKELEAFWEGRGTQKISSINLQTISKQRLQKFLHEMIT